MPLLNWPGDLGEVHERPAMVLEVQVVAVDRARRDEVDFLGQEILVVEVAVRQRVAESQRIVGQLTGVDHLQVVVVRRRVVLRRPVVAVARHVRHVVVNRHAEVGVDQRQPGVAGEIDRG